MSGLIRIDSLVGKTIRSKRYPDIRKTLIGSEGGGYIIIRNRYGVEHTVMGSTKINPDLWDVIPCDQVVMLSSANAEVRAAYQRYVNKE